MKNNKEIENRLENLGDMLRAQPSVIKNGMQKIEHIKPLRKSRSASATIFLYKSGIGLAACFFIGIFLWFIIFGATGVTLADVQKSIENKTWILITHHGKDKNVKEWINLKERKYFSSRQQDNPHNFHVIMRDHVKGIWLSYHNNWGEQIHEETFDVRPYPQTPWEYVVGDWQDNGQNRFPHTIVEKINDTIDGRNVIRFDTYYIGPLDLRILTEQVWADPKTRLPLRIRQYSSQDEFTTGDFSFPETGPSSIYDLGVSRELPIVHDAGVIEPDALTIINSAKEALQNLPENIRIIERRKGFIEMHFRIGNKLRIEYYGKLDDNNSFQSVEFPETNDNIRQWAVDNLTLFKLIIYDDEYEYSSGIKDAPFVDETYPSIEYRGDARIEGILPISRQWSYRGNVGPIQVLKDEPNIPAGCVLLRWQDMGLRRDWYIDTEHDYICVKRIESREYEDSGEFINPSEIEWTNLTRFPSGQWYAKTIERKGEVLEEYDVKLLSEPEIEQLMGKNDSKGFFDGTKVIKSEMDKGKKVRFWAK